MKRFFSVFLTFFLALPVLCLFSGFSLPSHAQKEEPRKTPIMGWASWNAYRTDIDEEIILSQAVTYVATAPKSNAACNAIFDAMASVKRTKTTVPSHLQDAHYKGAQKLGHGIGYKYAHNYPHHYVEQQYLPDEIVGEKFYVPSENGHEKEIKEWMRYIRKDQ